MQTDRQLRQHLIKLLKGGDAHADFDTAIRDLPASLRGKKPEHAEHSPWEILEHMRIAQWDILDVLAKSTPSIALISSRLLAVHTSASGCRGLGQEFRGLS
ncbi:MAG: hypothetical protein ABSF70_07200 [Terracidiphilus sp.]|jgi:hypothetical protein